MPALRLNDIILFTERYQQQGQVLLNTCYFRYLDSFAGTDQSDPFLNGFLGMLAGGGGFIELQKAFLSVEITIVDIRAQVVYPDRYTPVIMGINLPGEQAGAAAPINSAMTVTKKSTFATRWGQGSWHQPGWPISAMQNSGVWKDDDVNGFKDTMEQLFQIQWQPPTMNGKLEAIIWSRATPGRTATIVKTVGNKTIRTERRRTVGVGK